MDSKEADILSQVLGVLLEGQELDQNRLEQLENRLQQIAATPPSPPVANGSVNATAKHQAPPAPSAGSWEGSSDDPFANESASTQQQAAVSNPQPEPQALNPNDPFGGFEAATPTPIAEPEPQLGANGEELRALETEIGLLKDELKDAKSQVKKYEKLYRAKEEEAESNRGMLEMTVNHVMNDMQHMQDKLVALDDMERVIKALQSGIYGSKEQFVQWFPNGFFWSQKTYSEGNLRYYCVQQFSVKYIIAISIPCSSNQRDLISMVMQLLFYARVSADRYTTPSLIYEFYEDMMAEIEAALSLKFDGELKGIVIAIDEDAQEVALAGNKVALYQQDGNLVRALEMGTISAGDAYRMGNFGKYRVRRFPLKSNSKFIIPFDRDVPDTFNNYLKEYGSLSSGSQLEHLQEWRARSEFPESFAFIHIQID